MRFTMFLAKIPDALLHGLVTSGRPLVGAASALLVYGVMHSNLIGLIDASKISVGPEVSSAHAAPVIEGPA